MSDIVSDLMTRIGKFTIPRSMLMAQTDIVQQVYGMCIPIRVEMMFAHDALDVTAISKYFDHVEPGAAPGKYNVIVEDSGLVRFERKSTPSVSV